MRNSEKYEQWAKTAIDAMADPIYVYLALSLVVVIFFGWLALRPRKKEHPDKRSSRHERS